MLWITGKLAMGAVWVHYRLLSKSIIRHGYGVSSYTIREGAKSAISDIFDSAWIHQDE